ncbi:snaclec macrovipecetin subunit beta-like [Asterias amurensis]|uniref:snaclec macrovipecetin subunit beta-like n=1 Tax=Asterias amurensis TaxID=7602 RepID=UPI003AB521A5
MVSANLLSFVLFITALVRHASGCYNLPCIPGWYPWRDHCYLVYPPPGETKWFTFDQGEEFCNGFQNKQVKGHLVSILDQEEQDFVIRLMSKIRPEEHFWIGLTDAAVEGVFNWTDGSVLEYTNWADKQPDEGWPEEDYVVMAIDEKWNDARGADQTKARQKIMCKMTQFAHTRKLTNYCRRK